MMARLARLRTLTLREGLGLAEAFCSLAIASLAIATLRFRTVERLARQPLSTRSPRDERTAIVHVAWAVQAAARRAPFRAKCFEQGLAALWMLRRRGVSASLHYGAARQGEDLVAHVWVTAGNIDVIGCGNKHLFFELTCFS